MHFTAEEVVAKGAAWLDEHYPAWVQAIDLSILELSNCDLCVLGQVWTGCVPPAERAQLIAQAVAKTEGRQDEWWLRTGISEGLGYSILAPTFFDDRSCADDSTAAYGFAEGSCYDQDCVDEDCTPDYNMLLDEWTKVIIQRRLNAHPDVATENSRIGHIPTEEDLVAA